MWVGYDVTVTAQLRTTFGKRAFAFLGPAIWNSLPVDLRSISDNALKS